MHINMQPQCMDCPKSSQLMEQLSYNEQLVIETLQDMERHNGFIYKLVESTLTCDAEGDTCRIIGTLPGVDVQLSDAFNSGSL